MLHLHLDGFTNFKYAFYTSTLVISASTLNRLDISEVCSLCLYTETGTAFQVCSLPLHCGKLVILLPNQNTFHNLGKINDMIWLDSWQDGSKNHAYTHTRIMPDFETKITQDHLTWALGQSRS